MEGPDHRACREHAVLLPGLPRQRPARPVGHRCARRPSRPRSRAGSTTPFKFAVFGNWGKTLAAGNPDQANLISQIAQSGSRFAVTTGDNSYEVGSQKSYGDLYQVGDNTSAELRPHLLEGGRCVAADLPGDRQPRPQQLRAPHELPAGHRGGHLRRARTTRRRTAARTARPRPTTRTAGTRSTPGSPASTCSRRPGRTRTSAPPTSSRTTSTTTGAPARRSTSGSRTTSRPIRAHVRFAFHHFPLYSDQSSHQLRHVSPGRQFARGPAEAARRDRQLQRSLAQLPAQQRPGRRRARPT